MVMNGARTSENDFGLDDGVHGWRLDGLREEIADLSQSQELNRQAYLVQRCSEYLRHRMLFQPEHAIQPSSSKTKPCIMESQCPINFVYLSTTGLR